MTSDGPERTSLRFGRRGPLLWEDRRLHDTLFDFAHQRTAERVVHAGGVTAHGWFECTDPLVAHTSAHFLAERGRRVPVIARFSCLGGDRGSPDCRRDVRGVAVRLFTDEGNWDLVGSSIPVSFVQDALDYPALVNARRSSDPAAFWDLLTVLPEALHATLWTMSSRGLPRSLRTMDGFGVHTYRFVADHGRWTSVRFHWRAESGVCALTDDEAIALAGLDFAHHRHDLHDAIASARFPAWDLCVQVFDDDFAAVQSYDVLDPTIAIPDEHVAVRVVGRMVLDRVHDDRRTAPDDERSDGPVARDAELAFSPANLVPGIDVSDDPVLQARIGGYREAQAMRLGRSDVHRLSINRPRPSPVTSPDIARTWQPAAVIGMADHLERVRVRPALFDDHVGQPRQFWRSQPAFERARIVAAFAADLAGIGEATRSRVLDLLAGVDDELADGIVDVLSDRHGVGPGRSRDTARRGSPRRSARRPSADRPDGDRDVERFPSWSIAARERPSLVGRTIGVLIDDRTGTDAGTDAAGGVDDIDLIEALRRSVGDLGGMVRIVSVGPPAATNAGGRIVVDERLTPHSSFRFDAIAIALGQIDPPRRHSPNEIRFVLDAFQHLKPIGWSTASLPLLRRAGVDPDAEGVVPLERLADIAIRRVHERQRLLTPSTVD